ncbi:MAG: M1 family metallopeptidase [Bacteroidia bacterium]|nr:M1 family metallopeptidase [Bacteroidia bacterium]
MNTTRRHFGKTLLLGTLLLSAAGLKAQNDGYWQQKVHYVMDIDFDHKKHQYRGKQELTYYNNSPDTLHRVYYHLYFNAFQPGSEMDIRNQNLRDRDRRIGDRIGKLKSDEIGYQKILSLKQDGKDLEHKTTGTILEVTLAQPLLPGKTTVFKMDFEAQVPLQIRRSGRNSAEGIDYSMSQWYPKLCEYDYMGWHADPYIGREFYGVWGDFDVTIHMDKAYTIGATGYLQNPQEIGKGYETPGSKPAPPAGDKLHWHFKAPAVHDFAWGADPDYVHKRYTNDDGVELHFFYQPEEKYVAAWEALPAKMAQFFDLMKNKFGKYPYKQFSFVQGGDGGMEYPMMTLITGRRTESSLVGVSVHEAAHNWFYGVLATNETLYPWMDEGFTTYATNYCMDIIYNEKKANPFEEDYEGLRMLDSVGLREPLCTHGDWFQTNYAYGISSYSMGSVFLAQLSYITGMQAFDVCLHRYYNDWGFKHPTPVNFLRVFEKYTQLELDWYLNQYVYSLNGIDYRVGLVDKKGKGTVINLQRTGQFPMPLDVAVTLKNGSVQYYTIPLDIMRGAKKSDGDKTFTAAASWAWVNPNYQLVLENVAFGDVRKVQIDPSGRLADLKPADNTWTAP